MRKWGHKKGEVSLNNFTALPPWHKVQVIILLIILAIFLCKFVFMFLEMWQEYKSVSEGIEAWEEEQYNKKAAEEQHK